MRIKGKDIYEKFKNESGGHRWQRIPPTEHRGRVHTSTITVAVLEEKQNLPITLSSKELEIKTTRGSGKGGQHRNVTDSAVQVKHLPTGLFVRCESERCQHQNKSNAINILKNKLFRLKNQDSNDKRNDKRKNQVGSGMRGDKIRTIRIQDGIVKNHLNGRKISYQKYIRGFIEFE